MENTHALAWLAGILEGEGYFGVVRTGESVSCRIVVSSTDRAVIEAIQKIVGHGNIREQLPPNPKHKTSYRLALTKKSVVRRVCSDIWPYMMSRRRERVQEILRLLEKEMWIEDGTSAREHVNEIHIQH